MKKTTLPIKLYAAVELGSPASDCAHFGICSMEVISPEQWDAFQPKHIRQVKAVISIGRGQGLQFEFPLDGMRVDTWIQFFPPEGFRVDSAKVVPDAIVAQLGLHSGMSTVPGMYALTSLANGLVMEISLVSVEALAAAA
jgi:hypothetical protein